MSILLYYLWLKDGKENLYHYKLIIQYYHTCITIILNSNLFLKNFSYLPNNPLINCYRKSTITISSIVDFYVLS